MKIIKHIAATALISVLSVCIMAGTALASGGGYLHVAEAKYLTHKNAITLSKAMDATVSLGACKRLSARSVDCFMVFRRVDDQGLHIRADYVNNVIKTSSGTRAVARALQGWYEDQ